MLQNDTNLQNHSRRIGRTSYPEGKISGTYTHRLRHDARTDAGVSFRVASTHHKPVESANRRIYRQLVASRLVPSLVMSRMKLLRRFLRTAVPRVSFPCAAVFRLLRSKPAARVDIRGRAVT